MVLENSPCNGTELSLEDCNGIVFGGVGPDCTHDSDAGVVCTDGELSTTLCVPSVCA